MRRRSVVSASAVLLALLAAVPARAQQRDTTVIVPILPAPDAGLSVPDIDQGTTPGGAFLRAILLPGWGHASIGAYTRGGFYFGAETGTAYMLVRNAIRKGAAESVRDLREEELREALARDGVTDPDSVEARLDVDPGIVDARALVEARGQQFEDWLALGVFLVFLSGADAFVSAHLADFPEPMELGATVVPTSAGVAVEVGARVPVGPPRRR